MPRAPSPRNLSPRPSRNPLVMPPGWPSADPFPPLRIAAIVDAFQRVKDHNGGVSKTKASFTAYDKRTGLEVTFEAPMCLAPEFPIGRKVIITIDPETIAPRRRST